MICRCIRLIVALIETALCYGNECWVSRGQQMLSAIIYIGGSIGDKHYSTLSVIWSTLVRETMAIVDSHGVNIFIWTFVNLIIVHSSRIIMTLISIITWISIVWQAILVVVFANHDNLNCSIGFEQMIVSFFDHGYRST